MRLWQSYTDSRSSQIHVDRYKFGVYNNISDPFMKRIITSDAASTRFHACERFHRCEYVSVDGNGGRAPTTAANAIPSVSVSGKHVVYVNPVTMGAEEWQRYMKETGAKIQRGDIVNHLVSALHSLTKRIAMFMMSLS